MQNILTGVSSISVWFIEIKIEFISSFKYVLLILKMYFNNITETIIKIIKKSLLTDIYIFSKSESNLYLKKVNESYFN
jgi:hypothetical protein